MAIVNPHPEPPDAEFAVDVETGWVNTGLDQLEPNTPVPAGAQALADAVGDTPAELASAHDAFARAQNSSLDEIVFVIPKPWALDAAGQPVPASLSTDGDSITMTVNPASDAVFPIIADPTTAASPAKRGAPLRLMTFNIHGARDLNHAAQAKRIANVIHHQVGTAKSSPDRRVPAMVGLQEMCEADLPLIVDELNDRDAGTNTTWRRSFQRLRSTGNCPGPDGPGGFGNAIIRNVRVLAGDRRRFTAQDNRTDEDTGKRYERRGYIRLQVDVRGRTVEFLTTHLMPFPRLNPTVHLGQSAQLLNRIRNFTVPRAAVGDFNDTRTDGGGSLREWYLHWSRSDDGNFRDVDRCTSGGTPGQDCEEPTSDEAGGIRIDYIWTRGMGINYANVAGVNNETSDHDTLVASTSLP
ncbi:MAG: endonuclease/exonuclease/phosphatase family protein [Solirubrobacteraceae bacterium]